MQNRQKPEPEKKEHLKPWQQDQVTGKTTGVIKATMRNNPGDMSCHLKQRCGLLKEIIWMTT